jgi:hypothetical protein
MEIVLCVKRQLPNRNTGDILKLIQGTKTTTRHNPRTLAPQLELIAIDPALTIGLGSRSFARSISTMLIQHYHKYMMTNYAWGKRISYPEKKLYVGRIIHSSFS